MRLELDVDRRPDWITTPGQTAYLVVGPFRFAVDTTDGLSFGFAIRVGRWLFAWGVEPAGDWPA